MKADRAPKTKADVKEASLSPPPLKRRKVESTTTSRWVNYIVSELTDRFRSPDKAVSSFFTPASKKDPERITWRIINESLLCVNSQADVANTTNAPPLQKTKIAAFDLVSMIHTESKSAKIG